jgi:uncharacterized protein (UPF0332 family)
MPLPDDLLEQARHLANRERRRPKQASLRRAVSTAYYALFHLLIKETTRNWRIAEQRPLLARHFEHRRMKDVSEQQCRWCEKELLSPRITKSQKEQLRQLLRVAETFVQAQHHRHVADYDNTKQWTRTQALMVVRQVEDAFESCRRLRSKKASEAYLLSLLIGRQKNV